MHSYKYIPFSKKAKSVNQCKWYKSKRKTCAHSSTLERKIRRNISVTQDMFSLYLYVLHDMFSRLTDSEGLAPVRGA